MKFGFDVHGVIDTKPKFYSKLTRRLIAMRHEVHIITGAQLKNKLIVQLEKWGIEYNYLFSISDYHLSIGTDVKFKDSNNPMMDDDIWNRTKAEYCERNKIDLHIDDSNVYGKYFTNTVYLEVKGV